MTSRLRPVHFRWWLWFLLSLPFLPLASVMAADIAVDANCSLHDAIKSANWDSAIGGCSAGHGIDRIHLSQDITLTASLPEISNMVSIYGKGHTISAAKQFQHFSVEEDTTLWLNNVVLTNSHGTSIYNRGQLIIRDSLIRDNGDGENSGVIISFGDLTIRNSTILENQIRRNAVISASGEARIEDSIISSNSGPAVKGGRTLWIRDSTISGNGSDDTTRSAIEMGSGFLSMDNSTVSDNLGGGVHIRGGSTFIHNSSITGNQRPYDGGGIHLHNVRFAKITNSTISANQAVGNGGGIAVSGDTDVTLQHVTLANNIAESGGGMYHSEGSIKLLNSIISGNQPLDCLAILEQNSGSLIADGTCVPPFSGDPLLQPLTDIPAFHLLMDGSPAIGNADAEHCLEDDQRGMQRPMPEDGECDIGAIESRAGVAAEPTPAPAVCTLADQIRAFNADESVGACPAGDGHDTITLSDFDMTYSYLKLESELPAITSEITIEGGGNLIGGQSERRIFLVDGGKLTINDLSLYDGYAVKGGAVYVTGGGSLFIQGSRICRNLAQEDGGGIYAEGSSFVAIYNSTICDNEADDYAYGGGIYIAEESTLEVRNSDFLDNYGNRYGGAIYSDASSVTIRNSTFSGNRSGIAGGAIAAADSSSITIASSAFIRNSVESFGGAIDVRDSTLSVSDSTISGNRAEGNSIEFSSSGGGIRSSNSEVTLTHVTISENYANWGGGINVYADEDSSKLKLRNSILAGNIGDDCTMDDTGTLSVNIGNLIQDGTCNAAFLGDPHIQPLTGLRPHHPFYPHSPALGSADPEYCTLADQLGRPRPQGGGCDIGAVESALAPQPTPAPTVCTLYDQIIAANRDAPYGACPAGNGADTILLSEDIVLSEALPHITSAITIEGQGHSISGANAFRIFYVNRGGKLAVNNLKLRDGDAWIGGAIRVEDGGELKVSNSEFSGNSAVAGGAISVQNGHLTIHDSSFQGNRAEESGGALWTYGKETEVTIERSSLVNNHANDRGGAIESSFSDLNIVNTTISGNSAEYGGGIQAWSIYEEYVTLVLKHVTLTNNEARIGAAINSGADVILRNSIVMGSIEVEYCDEIWSTSTNMVEDDECLDVITGDPILGELGGEHAYHPLQANSPAIKAASPGDCPHIDQLGNPRPQGASCDIGAVEFVDVQATPSRQGVDGCSLADQIRAANTDQDVGGCPAGDGADTITLQGNIALASPLPAITSVITIEGEGYSIDGANQNRIFIVEGGALTINNLLLKNGNALRGGAILVSNGGNLHVKDSTLCGNDATLGGGAIYAEQAATLTISQSVLCANGTAAWDANGGVMYVKDSASLNIVSSQFDNNRTGHAGGAIYSHSSALRINSSAFSNNRSGYSGGAIAAEAESSLSIRRSAIANNSTGVLGGGIMIDGFSTLDMVNSTVAGNDDWQGGWETDSGGGGIYSRDSDVTLTHVSFVANMADKGSGLYASGNPDRSEIKLFNTFLESNHSSCHFEPPAILTDSTGSIADYKSCEGMRWDWLKVDRHLLTPPYYSLYEDSPLINAADPKYCLDEDQLGNPRPQGEGCDIGAIEFMSASSDSQG